MRFFLPATLVALSTLVCLSSVAQEGTVRPAASVPRTAATAPNGTNVAVVDIAYIFKNLNRFNTDMKELETETTSIRAWVQQRDKELQAMKESLKDLKQGTPDFQKKEEKLASEGIQFQLEVRRREQEVALREAGIYYDAYAELEKTVSLFAQRNRIGIVLKYNRDTIKREDRRSVMEGLSRAVVYQSQLDISNAILTELNKGEPVVERKQPGAGGPPERTSKKGTTKTGLK